ncbi:MAG: hypothetical protein K8L97_21940 [Anaerolineae bacterium]|nr:hypothetical protein [Anaerolineae bacterium]
MDRPFVMWAGTPYQHIMVLGGTRRKTSRHVRFVGTQQSACRIGNEVSELTQVFRQIHLSLRLLQPQIEHRVKAAD